MAIRFMDGFDHYLSADMTLKWTTKGDDFLIETGSSGRYNGYCVKFSGGGGPTNGKCTKIIDAQPTWIVGVAFKTTIPTVASRIIVLNDGGTDQVELRINSSAHLVITRNGTVLGTGTTTLIGSTWYYLEFKCTISDSISAHTCVARINGVTEIDLAAATDCKNTANSSADRIYIVAEDGGTVTRFDDLIIMDGTGGVDDDFKGDTRIETLWPSGAGSTTNFTPSTGSNYQCCDETQENSDTDYVSSSTTNHVDSYAMGNLSSTPLTIFAVQVTVTHRKDDAGSHTISPLIHVSSTDYTTGSAFSSLDSYSMASSIWTTNPNTSAAWIASGVNGMEAGIKLVS